MAYELIKQLENWKVLRLEPDGLDLTDQLTFPFLYSPKVIWFIDDLNKYIGKRPLDSVKRILDGSCRLRIVATCREGKALDGARKNTEMCSFLESFGGPISCQDLSLDEWVALARSTGKVARRDLFDGTPGSVTLRLDEKKDGLGSAHQPEKEIMRGMYLLLRLNIYDARPELLSKVTTRVLTPDLSASQFDAALTWLKDNEFLLDQSGKLRPKHDVYLTDRVFEYYPKQGSKLGSDLKSTTSVVEEYGCGREIASAGVYWGAAGRHDLALGLLEKAAEKSPDDATVKFHLGYALYASERTEDAIEAYKRAIELSPAFFEARTELAIALEKNRQIDEAIAAHREAIGLRPRAPEPVYNLAHTLLVKGQLNEAIKAYHKAIKLQPTDADAHDNLGNALMEKGQVSHAMAHYRRAIKLRPDHANAYSNLGDALREKGDFDQAIIFCRRAIQLRPDHAGAHVNLGAALLYKHQFNDSIEAYNRAVELNPNIWQAYHGMAIACQIVGRIEDAKEALSKARALNPVL